MDNLENKINFKYKVIENELLCLLTGIYFIHLFSPRYREPHQMDERATCGVQL